MAALVPLAHVGHWLWVLYVPPVLIVIGSLVRSKLKERKLLKSDSAMGGTGEGVEDVNLARRPPPP